MKFTLTIQDASLADIESIIGKINGSPILSGKIAESPLVQNLNSFAAPVVTPPAPTATVTQTPTPPQHEEEETDDTTDVSGQVDSAGFHWDKRIHSSSKKKKANGEWVARRNVPDEVYNAVVAEIKGQPAAPVITAPAITPSPAAPAAPIVQAPTPTPVAPSITPPALTPEQQFADIPAHMVAAVIPTPVIPTPVAPVVIPAPVPSAPVAPVAPAPAATTRTVNDLLAKIQSLFLAVPPQADAAYVTGLQQKVGGAFGLTVNSIMDIQSRPDAIEWAFAQIAADGK